MSAPVAVIPMQDLALQNQALEPELMAGLSKLLASGRFVQGETVQRFESELAAYCGARHAVTCNSGTDALWLALRALDVGPGDAVLCPAFSFFATAAAIVRTGARPIFADVRADTLDLDPDDALARLAEHPDCKAVLPVDLFGRICELGPLATHCRDRGIAIVEDAAQSIGAQDARGARIGAQAHLACLSFYPTKNLGALGDGGALLTSDDALAARIARLRNHGETAPGLYGELGINSRLDAVQAMVLSLKLSRVEAWNEARRTHAAAYDALFRAAGALEAHEPFAQGRLPVKLLAPVHDPARHAHHRHVVRIEAGRRAGLIEALRRDGIGCEVYYPRGLHRQPALAAFAPTEALVEVDRAAAEVLALPVYPELVPAQIERVVEAVVRTLGR